MKLGLPDAKFEVSFENQLRIIKILRRFQPKLYLRTYFMIDILIMYVPPSWSKNQSLNPVYKIETEDSRAVNHYGR